MFKVQVLTKGKCLKWRHQKHLLRFFFRKYKAFFISKNTIPKIEVKTKNYELTVPNCPKKFLISSSFVSTSKPPTNIFPCLAFAFLGSTFLLLITWSPAAITFSIDSMSLKTMKAKPLDLPDWGSVLTLTFSISPYCPKCSLNSSAKKETEKSF